MFDRPLTALRSIADRDVEISPGSAPPQTPSNYANSRGHIPSSIAPWENPRGASSFGNHRRDLAVLESAGNGRVPAINRQPPSALTPNSPWGSGNGQIPMPSSVFGSSFFDDSSEDFGGMSPGFRPGSSQEDMAFPGEDRRPSIASATTVSSIGSKSSVGRGFHKKLQGFFGDEFPSVEGSRQNSDASLPPAAMYGQGTASDPLAAQRARNRNHSFNSSNINANANIQQQQLAVSRPGSPASFTRPRTPHSSEVTPWEFQDFTNKVSQSPSTTVLLLLLLCDLALLTGHGRNYLHLPIKLDLLEQELPNPTTLTSCTCLITGIRKARKNRRRTIPAKELRCGL
jgi:adenylate cyclase